MADERQTDRLKDSKGRFAFSSAVRKSKRVTLLNRVKLRYDDHSYAATVTDDHEIDYDETDIGQNVTVGTDDLSLKWTDGRRIVNLKHLADGLYCRTCKSDLFLKDIVGESRRGLGSFLHIQCKHCCKQNLITTGKQEESGGFVVNKKMTLAMVHSGMGPTEVQQFLSTCFYSIPPPDIKTIKKNEKELSTEIVNQAKKSCTEAREEEKTLVTSCTEGLMEASFDAGWQTRGSGCQYNSNTGHASLFGTKSGKVLDFDVKSKTCSICNYHIGRNKTIPDHICNINWRGSSKAMEPEMATNMLRNLNRDGYNIDVIHADNDTTTFSRLKTEFPNLQKRADKNHYKKNISKWLRKISTSYTELRKPNVTTYLTKLLMYPVNDKNNTEEQLSRRYDSIIQHVFGNHTLCEGKWCTYIKNPAEYRYKYLPKGEPLKDEKLRHVLTEKVQDLKKNASQLLNLGSTQNNENFNNIVASKAPKNRSYSKTSLMTRVSSAVLQKNDGYKYLNKLNKEVIKSPGVVSNIFSKRMDHYRKYRKARNTLISTKRKRLLKKRKRFGQEKVNELKEGKTYDADIENRLQDQNIDKIPEKMDIHGKTIITFDIETTGLSRNSDIIQLSAYNGNEEFNNYIHPNKYIGRQASNITGITYSFDQSTMFHNGKEVKCEDLRSSLINFVEYLERQENPVLVGHNIMSFDIPILSRKLLECNMLQTFLKNIHGCLDTLKIAKQNFKKEDVGNFKQSNLVSVLLQKNYQAHNALEDIKILHELLVKKLSFSSKDMFHFNIHNLQKSFQPVVEKKVISNAMARKLASVGLNLKHLKLAYDRDMLTGIKTVLSDYGFKNRISTSFQRYFSNHEE